jgi:hypothetical protein
MPDRVSRVFEKSVAISSRDFNSVSTFVYRGHGIPVFAVYSNRKFLPLRLNVFLQALAAWESPLWIKE